MRTLLVGLLPIAFIGLSGCQKVSVDQKEAASAAASQAATAVTLSAEEKMAVGKLSWVKNADAAADAKAALSSGGTPKLIAFSGRTRSHPGLTAEQYESIKDKVESQFAPGVSDTIHGDTHKAMLRSVRDYAAEYNMAIFKGVTAG